jgi:catechol 2,3-dioxygenase-like lactoylglutathione lyase family enzyme
VKLARLAHVNLSIEDVERSRAFYRDLLGLPEAPRPADAGRAGCWFELGGVGVHLSAEPGAQNASSKRHVAFEVEDLDAARAELSRHAVPIEEGKPMAGVRRLFVRDPSGNRIELFETARQPRSA